MSTPPDEQEVSQRFCASDADVIFLSSDGVKFHLHRKNLEHTTGGFPPAEISTCDELVPLAEKASTLERLFHYVYPERYADLNDIDFPALVPLSEAAEKYQVYAAMVLCKLRWLVELRNHPIDAINFGAKHDYMNIVDSAAPRLIKFPLEVIAADLAPNLAIPFMRYYGHWMDVLASMSVIHGAASLTAHSHNSHSNLFGSHRDSGITVCDAWAKVASVIIAKIGGQVSSLVDLPSIFQISTPNSCFVVQNDVAEWLNKGQAKIKKIPKFSTFL